MARPRKLLPKRSTPAAIRPTAEEDRTIVWTHCPQCGDIWTTRAVAPKGQCPVCRSKVKAQKVVI